VMVELSETDANQVRPGQAVSVTGPGFPGLTLTGQITSVAGQATPPSAAGGGPLTTFAATARLNDISAAQASVARIGMTANVAVDTYRNPAALVVPPAAIQGSAPAAFVMVRDAKGGKARRVTVTLGHAEPDGVEIVSGLKAGDTIFWSAPAPNPGEAPPS